MSFKDMLQKIESDSVKVVESYHAARIVSESKAITYCKKDWNAMCELGKIIELQAIKKIFS